ncbi:MAG: hypothetical protein IJ515_03995 [Clostridia bacterium]|nr:hypothetical protein [Clostridia bacterium]
MKNNFSKIIALILALASLVSMLTVFAWADETDTETDSGSREDMFFEPAEQLLVNRDFDDGWNAYNGANMDAIPTTHNITVDYEESEDYSYNYFARFEYGDATDSAYLNYFYDARMMNAGTEVIGLSIKADDACEVGTVLYITIGSQSQNKETANLLVVKNSALYALSATAENYLCSLADNDWYDIDIVLNWDDRTQATLTYMVDGEVVLETAYVYKRYETAGIYNLYLGLDKLNASNKDERIGMSFCVDNLRMYQDVEGPIDLSSYGYGIWVDTTLEKTVQILESAKQQTAERALAESLAMKLGVSSALIENEKIDITDYFIPAIIDGKVMVSLELVLAYLGYPYYVHSDGSSFDITLSADANSYITVGRQTATVAGKLVDLDVKPAYAENTNGDKVVVIAINDIEKMFPGWLVTYDDMGLIIVYENFAKEGEDASNLINRQDNLDTMLEMMKKFVFDTVTVDENGNSLEEEEAYTATGEKILALDENLAHPYIFANQSTFDSLADVYASSDADANLKSYIANMLAKADEYYSEVADESGETVTIKKGKRPLNVYQDNNLRDDKETTDDPIPDSDDGYNPNLNALYEIEEATEKLVYLAFAYQITGDDKYAELAYEVSLVLGTWVHWGPGYFVNCANAVNNFAVAYDWLYNAYVEIYGESSVETLAQIIYDKGLVHGYNSSIGNFCKFPRTSGHGDVYNTRSDYWNAIGTAGMVIGSLAIVGTDVYAENSEELAYLVGNNLINLANYGLDRYAPDGSYIDSVTYWAQGTNAFMQLVMALDSATGDDHGFKDVWGINSTFYYACYISNSEGEAWNYGDDGVGSIVFGDLLTADTQMFYYAGAILGDENLIALRQNQLAKGKEATLFDILFYPTESVEKEVELELYYYLEGMDTFVARSSWENGALYVGLMGGANAPSPYANGQSGDYYGQIDSGNFIYQNLGIKWIIDHGSDYYSADSYFRADRYKYFRNSGEGHNVVLLTSKTSELPYGQSVNGKGVMYDTYIDPDGKGSYAIINNSNAYGIYSSAAYRGMLVTNNNETVVIQDEIATSTLSSFAWVVNTAKEIVVPESEPTVAYLINTDSEGNETYLRATLIASNPTFRFTAYDSASTAIMPGKTVLDDDSTMGIGDTKRLVVKGDGIMIFQIAVVFEVVESLISEKEVGYEWISLSNWNTAFNEVEENDGVARRGLADKTDVHDETLNAEILLDYGTAFTTDFEEFFISLCTVEYTLKSLPIDNPEIYDPIYDAKYYDAYDDFLEYTELYAEYADSVNGTARELENLFDAFCGA